MYQINILQPQFLQESRKIWTPFLFTSDPLLNSAMDTSNLTSAELNALLNTPAVQPPPRVAHSNVNPYAAVAYATIVMCLVIPTTAVAGRIFARLRILHNIGLDDCIFLNLTSFNPNNLDNNVQIPVSLLGYGTQLLSMSKGLSYVC